MENKDLIEKIKKVKIMVMDIDGTLTDGMVYYSKNGEELKRFYIRDGMGIELLHKSGIQVGILTSENSPIVMARATRLKIEHVILGSRNKKKSLEELSENINIPLESIAYIGDDVNDLQAMQISGFSVCPVDSVESIKDVADCVLTHNGGEGAVRELAELILTTQNKPITLPESW
jgi:3-deoxy-D-manno-octulosonate 8-phosphate phosphatase (KDO 8-P phosphatase)